MRKLCETISLKEMEKLLKNKLLLNALFFQVSWWGYFLCARSGNLNGVLVNFILYSFAHFIFVSKSRQTRIRDLKLMLSISILGYLVDLFLLEGLLFSMQHKSLASTFWLFGMWWGFASSISYSLRNLILKVRYALPAAALFGPLSYWAGEKIEVLTYFKPVPLYYGLHGILWAGFFYILFKLSKRNVI